MFYEQSMLEDEESGPLPKWRRKMNKANCQASFITESNNDESYDTTAQEFEIFSPFRKRLYESGEKGGKENVQTDNLFQANRAQFSRSISPYSK